MRKNQINYTTIREFILNILFPRRCPVCGRIVIPKGAKICPGCISRLSPVSSPTCYFCGKELDSAEAEACYDCRRHHRSFQNGMALLNYNEAAAKSMAAIKYHNRREYLDFYAEQTWLRFHNKISRLSPDLIIPVPIHRSKWKKRGFNQAQEFAARLSRISGIPMDPKLLKRVRKTAPQKELSPSERLKNLEHAFWSEPLPQTAKTILLIDDIYTTGATAEACARALKQAGAAEVIPLCLCIGSK